MVVLSCHSCTQVLSCLACTAAWQLAEGEGEQDEGQGTRCRQVTHTRSPVISDAQHYIFKQKVAWSPSRTESYLPCR